MRNKFEELPESWQREIKLLRREAARYRNELRAVEAEVVLLRDDAPVQQQHGEASE